MPEFLGNKTFIFMVRSSPPAIRHARTALAAEAGRRVLTEGGRPPAHEIPEVIEASGAVFRAADAAERASDGSVACRTVALSGAFV